MQKLLTLFFVLGIQSVYAAIPVESELTGLSQEGSNSQNNSSPWLVSLTITNDYVFRGLTQTTNIPAFEGSLTYTWQTSGIYVNLWGSNVNLYAIDGSRGTVEIDTIVGIGNHINKDWSYQVSLDRYNYPRANRLSYIEGIGILTYKIISLTFAYTNNEFNTHVSGYYYALAINYELPGKMPISGVNLSGTVGYYDLNRMSGKSYANILLGASKDFGKFNLALQLSDTNHQSGHRNLGNLYLIGLLTVSL